MDLKLKGISKLYGETWIFRNINYDLSSGGKLAITGPNGSGKSTLLSIIIGLTLPTQGEALHSDVNGPVSMDEIGSRMSFAAPYAHLLNEFTAVELLSRISGFRSYIPGMTVNKIINLAMLDAHQHKPLGKYSTGMRQRLRLALAVAINSDLLILDEPTSNLDDEGKRWYQDILTQFLGGRTLIVASNERGDLKICDEELNLAEYVS